MRRVNAPVVLLVSLLLVACEQGATADGNTVWVPSVVARYPHDPTAFTQGLLYHEGYLYESTGRRGQSSLRKVDVSTGRVEQMRRMPPEYFAEGLAEIDGRLIQLTWQSGEGFVYEIDDFTLTDRFRYDGEGWGLTEDGSRLIMSDGSAELTFLDPDTFAVMGSVTVTHEGAPIADLNELEFIDGEIWANIWYDDRIVRIDPETGRVLGWIDLSALYPAAARSQEAVVNGIAYDDASDRLFVTGKLWPALFEIEIAERR